jgi:hypothetical protein
VPQNEGKKQSEWLLLQLSPDGIMHRECSTLCIGSSVRVCVCEHEPAKNEWNVSTAKVLIGRNHIVA